MKKNLKPAQIRRCKARLLKLAKHLESGKLGHERFDFWAIHYAYQDPKPTNSKHCGTAGCAIGECPVVFPRLWAFRKTEGSEIPVLSSRKELRDNFGRSKCFLDAERFFGITPDESSFLFEPNGRGNGLEGHASPKEVAANIRLFVAGACEPNPNL